MFGHVVPGSIVLELHVGMHRALRTKAETLRTPIASLLELPTLTNIQVPLLNKALALRTELAAHTMGSKTFPAMKALIAFIAQKLEQKNIPQKLCNHTLQFIFTTLQLNALPTSSKNKNY